ncbi:calcium-translocating P-type ATPase, SERCA-type [Thermovenabulum gondwanense]|uniref:Calcium-transporting ATPase n=1 Tax=Thermovenabulum gondwanense TaxID=520767 RepID=A0A162MVN2_9FIRM|nr:calcium-translocating P-type ATPase, SERCA-type [Thermovenabulum gondwanense]KYO67837.1 Calcium-transporting ATPase [Thermovenabulum gondwanense]
MQNSYSVDIKKGLTNREVMVKKRLFGKNEIIEKKKVNPVTIFLNQYNNLISYMLFGSLFVSYILGEITDSLAILIIILINGIMGFIQEYRAEKSLDKLKELTAPTTRVLRDGEIRIIPARDVVPGDVVLLESGDRVPADGKILECESFLVDESLLTGESFPVEKRAFDLNANNKGLKIHRKDMVFMGTLVISGRAKILITETGMNTEMGRIAHIIQSIEDKKTPLQKKLEILGEKLIVICSLICVFVSLVGILRGESMANMFLFGVSLAVAAIPEGLPAIVTIVLAMGVQRMAKKNALIRRLPAVETLGCATVICSDKTGTLTENKMTVRKIYANNDMYIVTGTGYRLEGEIVRKDGSVLNNGEELRRLFEIAVSCNNAYLKEKETSNFLLNLMDYRKKELTIYGDSTEAALIIAGLKGGVGKEEIDEKYVRVKEIPFNSDRKRMSVMVKTRKGELLLFTKGAPEVVVSLCKYMEVGGKVIPLTFEDKERIMKVSEEMGREALRVLAFAYKHVSLNEAKKGDLERDLIFSGLMGMIDPPRREVKEAIEKCFTAGIKPVMITGDHKSTAWAIAKEVGLLDKGGRIITGEELDKITDKDLEEIIEDIAIYARVSPQHKLRIVRLLKKRGHVVAMTGDGVNDAPAIKEADIGISMGLSGTDVTKEASAMVLTDDNFRSIVNAVEEGRIIYENIKKFIRYLLSCNTGEVLTMIFSIILGLPLPLFPTQILLMNLVTDGLPAMALGIDPPVEDVMKKLPRRKKEDIFAGGLGKKIFVRGVKIGICTIISYIFGMYLSSGDLIYSRTLAYSTLIVSQLIFAFECRNDEKGITIKSILTNIYLLFSVIISFGVFLLTIYVPNLQGIFHTVPLDFSVWIFIIAISAIGTII